MRRCTMLALPLLAACSGGSSQDVLSESEVQISRPGHDILANPPDDSFVTDVSFTMLLNDERAEGGVRELAQNEILTSVAQGHANDMVTNNYLSHTGRDGSSPGDRADAAGYDWNFIAENIARGFNTEPGVMQGWMGSEGHRENILDPRAEDFGIARVDDVWVLMLGREFE
jgi:uncharacterized protein YkwD